MAPVMVVYGIEWPYRAGSPFASPPTHKLPPGREIALTGLPIAKEINNSDWQPSSQWPDKFRWSGSGLPCPEATRRETVKAASTRTRNR